MILKNDALQELYDTLSYGPILSSPYTESPIDRAFKECDEKLSGSASFKVIKDIQNRCDNLERSNKAFRDDNDKLSDKAIELAKKNEQLEKDLDAKSKENSTLVSSNADLSDRLAKLQRNFDHIDHLWTGQIQENMELRSKITNMQREKKNYETIAKEREDLLKEKEWVEKQLNHYKSIYYDLSDRAGRAEDEVKDLKKKLDTKSKENSALIFTNAKLDKDLKDSWQNNDGWRSRALEAEKRVGELLLKKYDQAFEDLRKERDRYSGLYTELKKDYDRLFEENRSLKEKVVDLKKRIAELQKKGDDLTKKGEDLKKRLNSVYGTVTCGPDYFYKDGMYDLWSKMREVVDSTYSERLGCFTNLCDIEDLLEWKLEDFLDEYEKWQEKKEQNETDRMRKWLDDFCTGRLCSKCPLNEDEFKCGCGYSFKKTNESDTRIIPDEDIKRYYEKARGCGRYTLKDATFPTTGVNRAISKACEEFRKAVLDADNKITENLCKGCTLEAKVEGNKYLLEKVCGIKPKEEEHKLDYGDAVRVPWRDYDYMYIGPEGKHIRLFDPKTHAVVLVSVTDNLTYQGYKIILCDEDDIRKIWKDKK